MGTLVAVIVTAGIALALTVAAYAGIVWVFSLLEVDEE